MSTKLTVVLMGVVLLCAGTVVPLRAHHAFAAEFDEIGRASCRERV